MTAPGSSVVQPCEELAAQEAARWYGWKPKIVRAVPGGTVGFTYALDACGFLKLYDTRMPITARCIARLDEQLKVLEHLASGTALADRVCRPLRTAAGALFFAHDNIVGVLYSLIPGKALGYGHRYDAGELAQVQALVRDLHAVDTEPLRGLCPEESFDLGFVDALEALVRVEGEGLPAAFARVVMERQDALCEKIQQARQAARVMKEAAGSFVLCHTDLHGGNLMRTPEGRLMLVDWENVMLAPPEADVFSLCEEYPGAFDAEMRPEALQYYAMRRDLEDIWEFLCSAREGAQGLMAQQEMLGHVRRILVHLCGAKK